MALLRNSIVSESHLKYMIDTLHYSVVDQVLDTGLDQSQFDICQRADPHDVVASIDVGDYLERNVAVN